MQKIPEEQHVLVTTAQIACDGGGGVLGHPRVFLTLPIHGAIACPYCGKHYERVAHATQAVGH